MLNWSDRQTHVLYNPAWSEKNQAETAQALIELSKIGDHIWLQTSGSTGRPKWVGLKKSAFLCSALAVNRHIGACSKDTWVNVLPTFHVGGLSIHARAFMSDSKVVSLSKWSVEGFMQCVAQNRATLTSLVPTQLFDLLQRDVYCPRSLRVVLVGGGALSHELQDKAFDLGWPILKTYGMTETCSMVAAGIGEVLPVLDHVHLTIVDDRIVIASESLLTRYAEFIDDSFKLSDPKRDGLFYTSDLGQMIDGCVKILGRSDDTIKILGEKVNITDVESRLSFLLHAASVAAFAVVPIPHERRGTELVLCTDVYLSASVVDTLNAALLPFERIYRTIVTDIPRSSLGKIKRTELKATVDRLLGCG